MHRVIAECWLLGLLDGHLAAVDGPDGAHSPTWTVEVADGMSPMTALAEMAPVALAGPPHSTSWRFVDGAIVLSFVAMPSNGAADHLAADLATHLRAVEPHHAADSHAHSPITAARVVSHAARHVAWLLATDPAGLGLDDQVELTRWLAAAADHIPTVFRDLTGEPTGDLSGDLTGALEDRGPAC